MDIISLPYVLLAIIAIFIYYLLNHKYRNVYLAILSSCFVAGFSIYLLAYVLAYAFINYYIGLKIPAASSKKLLFRTGIIFNLLQLTLLRYSSFAIDPVLELFNSNIQVSRLAELIVPIGISYFTMQGIGYLVNIKMGWEKPEKKFTNFFLYITFFPKFLSGPIERSNHFLPMLKAGKEYKEENVLAGLKLVLSGFFKKVIIANHLATTVASAYAGIDNAGGLNVLLVVLVQPLYLYFDFSGYTDIALGIAKAFGIDLLPNFNRPFLSENITTLWRRMHMSLSLWFNDYVFKQTSFKLRKWGKYAAVAAVFVTFTLFGIWHGAGWTFMIMGFLQAAAINYEFFTKKWRIRIFAKMPGSLKLWTGRIGTYLFFGFSHIFFFSPDIRTAFTAFSKLQYINVFSDVNFMKGPLIFGLFFAVLFMAYEVLETDFEGLYNKIKNKYWIQYKPLRIAVYYIAAILILSQLSGGTTFIYEMF